MLARGYLVRVFHHDSSSAFVIRDSSDQSPDRIPFQIARDLIQSGQMDLNTASGAYDDWRLAEPAQLAA